MQLQLRHVHLQPPRSTAHEVKGQSSQPPAYCLRFLARLLLALDSLVMRADVVIFVENARCPTYLVSECRIRSDLSMSSHYLHPVLRSIFIPVQPVQENK